MTEKEEDLTSFSNDPALLKSCCCCRAGDLPSFLTLLSGDVGNVGAAVAAVVGGGQFASICALIFCAAIHWAQMGH